VTGETDVGPAAVPVDPAVPVPDPDPDPGVTPEANVDPDVTRYPKNLILVKTNSSQEKIPEIVKIEEGDLSLESKKLKALTRAQARALARALAKNLRLAEAPKAAHRLRS